MNPPLHLPWPDIPFTQAFVRYWRKGFTFSGRASAREYWFVALWQVIIGAGLGLLFLPLAAAGIVGLVVGAVLSGAWSLASIVPGVALGVRRLHDTDRSGGLYLLCLVPAIGDLILLILLCQGSSPYGARFDLPGPGGGTPAAATPRLVLPAPYDTPAGRAGGDDTGRRFCTECGRRLAVYETHCAACGMPVDDPA